MKPSPDKIFLYRLDAKYKPEKKPKTPVFNRFLNQISGGDKSIKRRLLAALGYCLIPDQAKVAIVFAGVPNSGKSLIGRFLQNLIGDDLVSAVAMDDLGGARNFLMGQLVGKVLNVAMDMNSDCLTGKAVSNLKGLTGRDLVPVENKFDDPFFHRSITKHVFGTNTQVRLKKDDPGFWERILIVPCLYGVDPQDQDPDLLDRLMEERNGIICQLMRAARKLIHRNYVFPKCEVADKIKASWRKGLTNSVEAFLDKCCSFEDADAFTPIEDFCANHHFRAESKNQLFHIRNLCNFEGDRVNQNNFSILFLSITNGCRCAASVFPVVNGQ